MDSTKYIGLDVHKESISIAVLNAAGKIVMECAIDTNATLVLQFLVGCAGTCMSPSRKEPRPPGCTR